MFARVAPVLALLHSLMMWNRRLLLKSVIQEVLEFFIRHSFQVPQTNNFSVFLKFLDNLDHSIPSKANDCGSF